MGSTENTPADPAYFAAGGTGLASDANVLWGEYFFVNSASNKADSQTAVHIVADADVFSPGDYTFYGRYVGYDGRDDRAPLSSLYYVRYLDGGPFSGGTDLIVWRDNRDALATGRSCGTAPSWAPLGEFQMVAFDEEENPTEIPNSQRLPARHPEGARGQRRAAGGQQLRLADDRPLARRRDPRPGLGGSRA